MKKKITRRAFCAIILTLPFPAGAQRAGKMFRIGFLDGGTAAGSAVLVMAFLDELSKLDGLRERISPSSTDSGRESVSVELSLRRTWSVLRSI